MNKKILITDVDKIYKSEKDSQIVYWIKGLKKKHEIDILEYAEKNSKKFKKLYNDFINNLNKKKVKIGPKVKNLKDYLTIENFESLKYTSVNEKCNWGKSFFLNEIIKCYALNEFIKSYKPKFVKVHLVESNESTYMLLKKLFKKNNIKYEFVINKKPIKAFSNKIYLFELLKTILIFFYFVTINFKFFKYNFKKYFNFKSDILFISYLNQEDVNNIKKKNFESSYWGDLFKLTKNKKISWIYLGGTTNNFSDKINISNFIYKKDKNFKNERHVNLYDFLTLKNIFLSIKIWLNLLFKIKNISNLDKILIDEKNNIDNNSFLKKDFIFSFYSIEMIKNILIFLIFKNILSNISYKKKCFYLFERAPWERSLIKNFRMYKHGKIYAVGHSTISNWDLRYFLNTSKIDTYSHDEPDYFVVNSKDMKRKMLNLNYKKNKIIIAEALRYYYLKKINSKNFLKLKNNFTILMILDINVQTALKQLTIAKKLISDFKNIKLIIKTHPTSNLKKYIDKDLLFVCTEDPLKKLFVKCDIVITSNITSANSEAAYLYLPILCFDEADSLNLCPILDNKIINFFNNYMQLKSFIEKKRFYQKHTYSKNNIFLLDKKKISWTKLIS